ncbi:Protein IMPAIRED IN BABA-INDUCED STERILITY 1 [Camellia lanceoleosa]|uniref:Protein IMPAIRED IN BABA-INDUCED STERILITY 1 n=1 Tax=Camellia lanceoleosa TaxID=1840588 RepID=A0ACC0I3L2_9ERIC|nr:Protein IMPAIRED IN BABA-INDUCED STERILITY 1 [Camellia lanceoleosa]
MWQVGQGTYSSVFHARNLETGRIVALKKVRFDNFEPESVRFMAREIMILRRLDHPNIIKLEGLITSQLSCSIYLVFEYMEHDISGLLSSPDIKLSEAQLAELFSKDGMSFLASCQNLVPRPWVIDDLDVFILKCGRKSWKKVVISVDNSGADTILGILPFARELLRRGTQIPEDARSNAWVSFDGKRRQQLSRGDSVRISMSQHPLPTVNKSDQTGDWFHSLIRCLNWNERLDQKAL